MKLFFFLAIVFLSFAAYVAVRESAKQRTTQESVKTAQKQENIEYRIVRDTVYIDRSRPVNKPWYSYEIESGEDSIYLYSVRELIKALSREDATVFAIDSLIILDNL